MNKAICLAWTFGLCVGGVSRAADELTDPIEILKKADAAAKAVGSVRCTTKILPTGPNAAQEPKIDGTMEVSGWANGAPKMFRYDIKIQKPGSSDITRITAGSDGEEYYVIDHATKTAYVDIDPAVLGSHGRVVRFFATVEFVAAKPFSDEINGKKAELKGTRSIGGEDCYEVHVVYANDRQEATWCFSKKDFLPRCRMDRFNRTDGQEPITREKTLTQLVADPKFDGDSFKFRLPAGYTKTDDFAP